jgi:hypothetical protein
VSVAEPCTISTFRGPAGLLAIAAEQSRHARTIDAERLADFLDWYEAYLDHLAPFPNDVLFCVVSRGEQTAAIIPLRRCAWRFAGIKLQALELPNEWRMPSGDAMVTDGADPADWIPVLLNELPTISGGRCDYLRLVNVLAESEPAAAFAREPGYVPLLIRVSGCCSVPVLPEKRWPERLSRNFRHKLHQASNRLEAAGGASFETATALGDIETAYEEFLRVEAAGWKGEQGSRSALQLDERLGAFYRQVMRRFAARGRCEVNLLRLRNRTVAGQFVFATGDTDYVLKMGYDQAFSRLSPGVAVMEHLFRRKGDSAACKTINFTTEMAWMKDWLPVSQDVVDVFLFCPTLRGRIALWYWRIVQAARFHRRKWVGPLYRRLLGTPAQRYRRNRQQPSPDMPSQ